MTMGRRFRSRIQGRTGAKLSGIRKRRGDRRGDMGREMEARVLAIGEDMVEKGLIERIVYHEPYSSEDLSGRDFTAVMVVGGEDIERSFGITISHGGQRAHKQLMYPEVPQWSLPWNINDETVQGKILKLFDVVERLTQEAPDKEMREFLAGPA